MAAPVFHRVSNYRASSLPACPSQNHGPSNVPSTPSRPVLDRHFQVKSYTTHSGPPIAAHDHRPYREIKGSKGPLHPYQLPQLPCRRPLPQLFNPGINVQMPRWVHTRSRIARYLQIVPLAAKEYGDLLHVSREVDFGVRDLADDEGGEGRIAGEKDGNEVRDYTLGASKGYQGVVDVEDVHLGVCLDERRGSMRK